MQVSVASEKKKVSSVMQWMKNQCDDLLATQEKKKLIKCTDDCTGSTGSPFP